MVRGLEQCSINRCALLLVATIIELVFVNAVASGVYEANAASAWYEGWVDSLWLGSNSPYLDVSRSSGLLSGLSLSGYAQITAGMWANSSALTNFGRAAGEHHGANSLVVERDLFQLDANYFLNGNNAGFVRFWGVYESPYPWEAHNIEGPTLLYNLSQSDFYNRYDIRDAYWKNTTGPATLFLGRQIVTWGESIAFRVGDVINPQDLSWNFGFANLEQSPLPLWMVHPIVGLPKVGPFGSNFLELKTPTKFSASEDAATV